MFPTLIYIKNVCLCFQVPDNAVMALVPKQVTAYNSVNNSTVSRTSASKYGERRILQQVEAAFMAQDFLVMCKKVEVAKVW